MKYMKMSNTKQITATIPNELADWVEKQPERGMVSFSKTILLLLLEVKSYRETGKKPVKDRFAKYIK